FEDAPGAFIWHNFIPSLMIVCVGLKDPPHYMQNVKI
ncbi:unnamed protein product, partial [marine sediment metagenome]